MPERKKEKLNGHYPFIAVVGPIGVGKTEFSSAFINRTGIKKFDEPFADNPYLEGFYRGNPKEYSFNSQMYFLMTKTLQMKKISGITINESVYQDSAFDVDLLIASAHRKLNFMTAKEFSVYARTAKSVSRGLPKPDVYFALKASYPIIEKRIIERGRGMELKMLKKEPRYFRFIAEEFENWLLNAKKSKIVIEFDTDKLDINNRGQREVVVQEALNWAGYYVKRESGLIFPSSLMPNVGVLRS